MHILDGMLDGATCVATGVASAVGVGYGLYRVRRELPERAAPLMGVTAACLFAAQMLNFPIPLGTSGHLLGGVLAAVMLGPWGGMVVMTAVVLVQCVLFQDGGVTALGANVFNMALIGSGVGYAIYASLRRWVAGPAGILAGSVVAAWFTVVLGAIACTVQIAVAGVYPLAPAMAAMVLAHSLIGLGEATITGLALAYVLRTRPDLIYGTAQRPNVGSRSVQVLLAGGAVALTLAVFVSPFASKLPDGLEWSLQRLGFEPGRVSAVLPAPLADYQTPGLENLQIAGALAGGIGVVVVFAIAYGLARSIGSKLATGHTSDAS